MSHTHFIKKCAKCDVVMAQCRCPSLDRNIDFGICEACKTVLREGDQHPITPEGGTPETDAEEEKFDGSKLAVDSSFARRLETERNALRAQLAAPVEGLKDPELISALAYADHFESDPPVHGNAKLVVVLARAYRALSARGAGEGGGVDVHSENGRWLRV